MSDAIPNTPGTPEPTSPGADDDDDEPNISRGKRRRCAKGTSILPLFADDDYVDDESPTTTFISISHYTSVIDKTNSEDDSEYVFSDIEITDELVALLDKTSSDDEYVVSDIEITNEVIALLDKTYSAHTLPDSDDDYGFSDIELNDAIIAELDEIRWLKLLTIFLLLLSV